MASNSNVDMTVIIPVYNVEEYLIECIESLMRQGDLRLEIILVNDGSTDRSGAIADQYAQRDSRIQVIHQENGGASVARNVGLNLAQGEYIAFLDSDDWVKKESLNELYYEAISHQADVAMGNVLFYHQDGSMDSIFNPVPKDIQNILFSGKECFNRLVKVNAYTPMVFNYIYRSTFLKKIQARFEEGVMHEDELWTPVVLYQASKMVAVDIDFYYYRQREGSVMHTTNLKKRLDALFRITDRLFEFSDRFDFSGEDGEFKNWLYLITFRLYSVIFHLLPELKDPSYTTSVLHWDRLVKQASEMLPIPQKVCHHYYRNAAIKWKQYINQKI